MLLYHTGPVEIRQPDIRYGRKNADFGQGFYLTPNIEFAEKWAKSGSACMNTYELNTEGLRVHRFDRDEEWFRYLSANRAGRPDSMPDADVIIGPIANDTLFDTLGILTSGYLSAEEALPLLMIGHQTESIMLAMDDPLMGLKPGKTYTWSADMKVKLYSALESGARYLRAYLYTLNEAGTGWNGSAVMQSTPLTADMWGVEVEIRLEATFTLPETRALYLMLGGNSGTGCATGDYIEVANMKLEEGDRATLWSPAPEDAESVTTELAGQIQQNAAAMGEVQSSQTELRQELDAEIADAIRLIAETRTAFENGIQELSSVYIQKSDQFTWLFNHYAEIAASYGEEGIVTQTSAWMRFDTDDNGDPVLEIGKKEADGTVPFCTRLSKNRLGFYNLGEEVAYVSDSQLHIKRANLLSSMALGNFTMTVADGGDTIVYA